MASAADIYTYESSLQSEFKEIPFARRDLAWVVDSNNSSYSGGQVIIETSQLANSGKYADFSQAFIEIPLVVAYKSSVDATAANSAFTVGLKNGFHQLIHSMLVEYNNTTVAQSTPFTNMYVSYKMMTTFSQDDVVKYGGSLNFFPDVAASVRYQNSGASLYGDGSSIVCPQASAIIDLGPSSAATYISQTTNTGYRSRLYNTQFIGGVASTASAILSSPQTVGLSNFTNDGGAAAARIYYTSILAVVRLKDFCEFFQQIPLVKGALIKLTLNMNVSSFSVAVVNNTSVAQPTSIVLSNGTNPLLVSSANQYSPNYSLPTGTLSVACGISSATIGSTTVNHNILRSCRLYCPLYTFDPSYEEKYLSLERFKTVEYTDIYQFLVPQISTGTQFTNLLTNGIVNPKRVVIIPILSGTAANNTSGSVSELQSCYSGVPACSAPLAAITAFNVALSGINVFQSNLNYDYECFLNEVCRAGSINGGLSTGMMSGLIDQYAWQTLYRFYTVDLSRRLGGDESVPKSVQITGTNATTKTLDLYTFIEYGRKVKIDVLTGALTAI